MLYFKMIQGTVTEVTDVYPHDAAIGPWYTRNEFRTLALAEEFAAGANALANGNTYIATDAGEHTYPRYDVVRLPAIGDTVSYSFNGDTYPDGEIVSISKTLKVIKTSTGRAYHRRRQTGSWLENGTWFLVKGHHTTRNPHI